jgi:hypothetical protein
MANKYSRYELQPYQSMYTDPKRVEVAQILRDRWDKNKQEYDLMQRSTGMMEVGQGDQHLKDSAIQDINDKFRDTIAMGNFENAGMITSGAVNDLANNEGLNAASLWLLIKKWRQRRGRCK